MDTLDERCLNCGGSVKYFPKKEIFICEYCRSKFTLDELKKNKERLDKVPNLEESFSELKDLEGYHCKNCGADIIVQKNTSSTRCVYCRSYSIIKNRLTGVYKPSGIIPFKYLKNYLDYDYFLNNKYITFITIDIILLSLMRHNGLYIAILSFISLMFYSKVNIKKLFISLFSFKLPAKLRASHVTPSCKSPSPHNTYV